jgi:hypothetical protein
MLRTVNTNEVHNYGTKEEVLTVRVWRNLHLLLSIRQHFVRPQTAQH